MNEKKKDNAFVRWTEKHAEIWKFIKFMHRRRRLLCRRVGGTHGTAGNGV